MSEHGLRRVRLQHQRCCMVPDDTRPFATHRAAGFVHVLPCSHQKCSGTDTRHRFHTKGASAEVSDIAVTFSDTKSAQEGHTVTPLAHAEKFSGNDTLELFSTKVLRSTQRAPEFGTTKSWLRSG
uniref:Uncharacterized protein n=1 Tax=Knipowitschia caucasica TaxID=637954 RepID=A0AAV2J4G4_KNICA